MFMGLTMFKLLVVLVCLGVEFGSADPGKPDHPPLYKLASSGLKFPHYELQEPLGRPSSRVRTVSVTCFPSYMEVHVKADLFELGVAVNPADLRLGANAPLGQACGVTSTSGEEYILQYPLTDCDARHWGFQHIFHTCFAPLTLGQPANSLAELLWALKQVIRAGISSPGSSGVQHSLVVPPQTLNLPEQVTEESLIYTNLLVYSPAPSVDQLVRTESAAVPVECHYRRRFDIGADPVLPTWIPHQTTKTIQETLDFTLRLMTSDWQRERGSAVYLLGDVINMEAAVFAPHLDLRVFIDQCVATPTPNVESVPRYDFVDNNGCLVDGLLTGSTSHFLPRQRPDKLQLQLKAFIFQHVESAQIYITCTLKAYPLKYASESMSKACSFFGGRWRSAEGDDWTCSSCQNQFQPVQSDQFTWGQEKPKYRPKPNSTESPQSPGKLAPFRPTVQADSSQWELIKLRNGLSPRTLQEPAGTRKHAGGSQKKGSSSVVLEQEVSVGPLSVRTWRNKVGVMVPPKEKEGDPPFPSARGKKPIPHHSLWRNGETLNTGRENLGTDADVDAAESRDLQGQQHSAVGGSLPVSTTTSPERAAVTVHPPLDSVHPAEERELATNTESPVHPSSNSAPNASQSESVSKSNPGSLLKNSA